MTYSSDDIIVFLSCKHTQRVDRRLPIGHEMQCRRCFRVSTITDTPNYIVDCLGGKGRSCPVGKAFGTLENSAIQYAIRHRIKFPHHVVIVKERAKTIHRFGNHDTTGELPLFEFPTQRKSRVVWPPPDDAPPPF